MAFIKYPSAIKRSILAFVKHMVSKSTYKDIDMVLTPCCIPSVDFGTYTCSGTNGTYGVVFNNVVITDPTLAGKTCELFFTSPDYVPGSAYKIITLDSNGYWTGTVQSSWEGAGAPFPFTISVTATLLATDLSVVHRSTPVSLTLPNCD